MHTTTHDDFPAHEAHDDVPRDAVEKGRVFAPNDPLPEFAAAAPAWAVDNTSLATDHHQFSDDVDDIRREAKLAVRAERQWCIALRELLAKAQTAFRALAADSEGASFYVYIALSALVVVAEAATGLANVFLITVPPVVRVLLLAAFCIFPPAAALGLGEAMRPLRFRHEYPLHARISAVLLAAFCAAYLLLTFHLRAASAALGAEAEGLVPSGLESWAMTIIAAGGYVLSITGALVRESWRRFRLGAEIRRLRRQLKAHERRLARAKADFARAGGSDDDAPPSGRSYDPPPTRPPTGALAAAVIAAVLAAAPHAAHAAPYGDLPRCGDSLAWLRTAVPTGARVELLLTTQDLDADQLAFDRLMAKTVLACASPGTFVTVRAITATALTDAPVWRGTVPAAGGALDPYAPARAHRFLAEGAAAIDRAMLPPSSAVKLRSDLLGALSAAAEDWSTAPRASPRLAVIVASAFVQSRDVNLYRWHGRAADKTDDVLRALRRDGTLPDLAGAQVYIVGVTHGAPGMGTTNAEVKSACRFMDGVTTAANGALKLCAGTLPGVARALSSSA